MIKIVQIGMNYYSHASQAWDTVTRRRDIFEVAGYVLPENEREKYPSKMKCFDGYPELQLEKVLADPTVDAVLIETDEIYLTKYAMMAARAGKHIHMEKPGGVSIEQFEQLINEAKRQGNVFHVGYMYRYNPIITDAIKRATSGELGEITSVEVQMNCIHKQAVQDWIEKLPGGMMFFLGCHLIDIILQIQGRPLDIHSFSRDNNKQCVALFEYANGVSFAKSCDTEYGGFDRRQLVITGREKTLEIRPLEVLTEKDMEVYTEITEFSSPSWHDRGTHTQSQRFERYEDMLCEFAKMVQGEKQNPFTYDYELELYRTILKSCGIAEE